MTTISSRRGAREYLLLLRHCERTYPQIDALSRSAVTADRSMRSVLPRCCIKKPSNPSKDAPQRAMAGNCVP
jgi:hypothetical protein